MTCLIQLNSHCWDCNNSIRAALNRTYGVTSVIFDSAYGTVKVTGRVEPSYLLSVVQLYDIHATLLWPKQTYYQYGYSSYADQYWRNSQPWYQQPAYCGRQHHHTGHGCNII